MLAGRLYFYVADSVASRGARRSSIGPHSCSGWRPATTKKNKSPGHNFCPTNKRARVFVCTPDNDSCLSPLGMAYNATINTTV